ncbi:MAG: hypothetical protein LCH96_06345 [Actinobacteria bacterium]|nr:hypothetical protein [Actinomycetota bacterium]
MPPSDHRPAALVVAVVGAGVSALAVLVLAVVALFSGHGTFSGGVGVALLVYGALLLVSTWGLWSLSLFGRGPVLALSLLNVAAAWTFTGSAPWMWAAVVVCAVTAVAAALPATSRALHLRRNGDVSEADEPRPTGEQGR